jgi:hypothetical protein
MKKLLIALLLLPSLAWGAETQIARMNPYILGGGGSAACSYTLKDSNDTGDALGAIGFADTTTYSSNSFTSGSGYILKKLAVKIKKVGDGHGVTLTIYLCEDSSGKPTAIGSCTAIGTKAVADLTASSVEYEFEYPTGYSISNATLYHIAFSTGTYGDASNYLWFSRNGATGTEDYCITEGGSIWSTNDATSDIVFKTYSCE